ncbi:hypothetical protein [Phascolarctobacterium faecium]|jgi:hypothetical protein|uniref:hypothetical protein n=1 Tax=Phascolarctobacterium faecium TaxID=33025 RepID=UPI001FCBE84A|nr:hypothetical protein [Phascolarctobacterium faecium]BDE83823.1 hypothetical protein CE91St52_06000 [Phascolarctobacterium faecium]BDE92948.1 hypothetical protein CE91St53_06000 [Phascolarctobacterium faecium]DAU99912.1 MAG TPA: hypothetical protein [Caudoviricetes sp.]
MFEKIKNLIVSARNKVASMSPKIMAVIVGYFIAVVLLIFTYYAAWLYMWLWLDKIVMSDLLALIREITGPAMVAFVTFIATSLVDKDGDGVPDNLEKEIENNGDKKNHFR